jgi:hypothetical protein
LEIQIAGGSGDALSSAEFKDLAICTFGFERHEGGGRIIEMDSPLYESER